MLIPLWVPWTLAVAALLRALLSRDHQGRRDVGLKAVAGLAVLVAVVLTVNRVNVDEGELYDAVAEAAALSEGQLRVSSTGPLVALVEDRLGRDVEVAAFDTDSDDPDRFLYFYEVRMAGDDDREGAAACLQMSESASPDAAATTSVSVSGGGCGD